MIYDHCKAWFWIWLDNVLLYVWPCSGNVLKYKEKDVHRHKQKSLDLQLFCWFEHIEAETVTLSQMAVDECIVSLRRWVLSEGGRQLLFDLDRECTPVMQAGETLVIFSLTESFQEENAITERHGDANWLLQSPSEQPGGVFHLQSGGLLGMVKAAIQPAGGKLILKLFSSVPSWIRQQERNESLGGNTTLRFIFVSVEWNSFLSNHCDCIMAEL